MSPGGSRLRWEAVAAAFGAAILSWCVVASQTALERAGARTRIREASWELPSGDALRRMSFGYANALADGLWLRSIQYVGGLKYSPDGNRWLFHAIDAVTTLDPRFETAYVFGGIVLGSIDGAVGFSNRILRKGMAAFPGQWRFPFYLSYNACFIQGDAETGARWLARASGMPGAPEYLPFLASRMFAEARTPAAAIGFLGRMAETATDPAVRRAIEERIRRLQAEEMFVRIEDAVSRYALERGVLPRSLGDLLAGGYLESVPLLPEGGSFSLDPSTAQVRHTLVKERLRIRLSAESRRP